MSSDDDFHPDLELIQGNKGRKVSKEEAAELHRCSKHMSMKALVELTGRSEDTIRKRINEIEAKMSGQIETKAAAFDHITGPATPVRAAPSYDEEDDYDEAPPLSRGLPPPPPMEEFDLDDLFEEDELVDPSDEDALAKKLYILLLKKKAVKEEDDARDIVQTFRMYPDYHNPYGLVEFLKGHDVKERKANTVSRILFGWQSKAGQQVPFNPGPVPGYHPGTPPPPGAPPGYQPYQQPWGSGMVQPTQYGQQYPYYQHPPPPPMPMPQGDKGITKGDLQQILEKRDKQLHEHYTGIIKDMEDKRKAEEKDNKLYGVIDSLRAEIEDLKMNPQTAPPGGSYVAVEEPEYDESGNIVRVRTSYEEKQDPNLNRLREETEALKNEIKEERKAMSTDLKEALNSLSKAKTETVRTEMEGQVKLLEQKAQIFDKTQERIDKINENLWQKEKEILQLEKKADGEMSETMQVANMQKDLFTTGLQQISAARKDFTSTLLLLAGKGKPAGANVEQWSEEELKMFDEG